jgi:hypothetical protein
MPRFKAQCPKCLSRYFAGTAHECYPKKNHNNENTHLKLTHQTRFRKRGDLCNCGNQDCRYCGGTGRIL